MKYIILGYELRYSFHSLDDFEYYDLSRLELTPNGVNLVII